jgi:hypothetical protein
MLLNKVRNASHTSVDTTHATKKAIQKALRVPCLGCVWVSVVMMIPANAGPQVAREATGYSHRLPLICAAL